MMSYRRSHPGAPDAPVERLTRPPLAPEYALAWSYTRHRMLRHCPRSLFWHLFGCRGQGLGPGDRRSPAAYALKQLQTLPLLVGTVVHNAAQRVARALLAGATPPTHDEIVDGGRFVLNQSWVNSQPQRIEGWWESPTHSVVLQEIVDRGHLHPEEIARARMRLVRCVEALLGAPLWEDVVAAGTEATWLPPAGPTRFEAMPDHPVWGAVDLAYLHADMASVRQALGEDSADNAAQDAVTRGYAAALGTPTGPDALGDAPMWCVTDFKTTARPDPAAEALQLAGYSCLLEHEGYPATDGAYLGRIVDLVGREDRWYLLTPARRAAARAVIADDLATLRGLMANPLHAIPLPISAWPLAANTRWCGRCRFHRLCADELESVQPCGCGNDEAGPAPPSSYGLA